MKRSAWRWLDCQTHCYRQQRWLDQVTWWPSRRHGVGKSTLVAKLAARWVLRHGPRDLVLISADSVRMGAQDQLQNLGRLLGVPTYGIDRINELSAVLNSVSRNRLVLIDTAGFSQRDARLSAELALLATSHPQLETCLVVAASAQAGTLEETFLRFAAAAPKSCVLTKVDEATSLGGSISALTRHAVPLAYMSEGQRIPEDLSHARAHQLVARAVELARRSGAQTDEELLSLRFGGVACLPERANNKTDNKRSLAPGPVQVIAVTGGKGGVGKTSVAINLATAMSSTGKRVMLLDGDLGLANVDGCWVCHRARHWRRWTVPAHSMK
jgi:signal recognition particle GTPase